MAKPNLSQLESIKTVTSTHETLERYAQEVGQSVQIELVDASG